MSSVQQSKSNKKQSGVTIRQRIIAGAVFLVILALFGFLWASEKGWMDPTRLFGICGFKEATGYPCMGCYMTRSGMAFASGRVLEAFYIQPAGAFLCCVIVVIWVFSLLIAVFGVNYRLLHGRLNRRVVIYIALSVLVILLCGWAVTFSRAFVERNMP